MKNSSSEFFYGHFRTEAELKAGPVLSQIVSPFLLLVGTFGNVLAVKIFTRKNMRKSFMSQYLIGLSVADLLVLYICLLREWIRYLCNYDVRTATNWLCKIHWWLYYVTLDYSVWLLTTISIVRMMSTFRPLSAITRFLKRHSSIVILAVCLISLSVNTHFLIGIDLRTLETSTGKIDYICGPGSKHYDYFVNYVWHYVDLCTFSLIPFLVLSVCNISIIYRVISNKGKTKSHPQIASHDRLSSMTKILVGLNFVFIICTLPICVYLTGMKYWVPRDIPRRIQENDPWYVFVSLLMYISNTINFFLYNFSGSRFRHELKQLFNCIRPEDQSTDIVTTSQPSADSGRPLECFPKILFVFSRRVGPEKSESTQDSN